MIEAQANHAFLIDIDGTINDDSKELEKWKSFCEAQGCKHYENASYWCKLPRDLFCDKNSIREKEGIFGRKAVSSLLPIEEARKNLWCIKKQTKTIWFLSGRSEIYRKVTLDWLEKHKFPIFSLKLGSIYENVPVIEQKASTAFVLKKIYGKSDQKWFWVDNDGRIEEKARSLGITFLKAPDCWR